MSLRRAALLVCASALFACTDVTQDGAPDEVFIAAFDSATSTIPLPNDLALQTVPAQPAGLRKQLLTSFIVGGGWPNDQVITVPIRRKTRDAATGEYANAAPPAALDASTLNAQTIAVLRIDSGTPVSVPFEASYAVQPGATPTSGGTLAIRPVAVNGLRRWADNGRYVVVVRGGPRGVKIQGGAEIGADGAIALISADRNLTEKENQPLGDLDPVQAAQLEGLRQIMRNGQAWGSVGGQWLPVPSATLPSAFAAARTAFPLDEVASLQTFKIQTTSPVFDSTNGIIPFLSDFLLDPTTGKVANNPVFGPAAAGLATLDGFSTTAPLAIPMTAAVDPATVTKANVRIYKIGAGPTLTQLPDLSDLAATPPAAPQIVTRSVGTNLVLAPAVAVEAGLPGGLKVYVPPLEEKSRYLVVVTSGVHDASGAPISRSTPYNLIFSVTEPLFDGTTTPPTNYVAALGLSDSQAATLQAIRNGLAPLVEALGLRDCAAGTCAAMAYTVTTQTIKDTSISLSALPYGFEAGAGQAVFTPGAATAVDPGTLGLPAALFPNVAAFFDATFNTVDAIDPATGAFDPDLADPAQQGTFIQGHLFPITALVAAPTPAAAAAQPNCPPPADALKCVPLVVVHHGLGGGRLNALAMVNDLAAKGFAVASIDAPYHGARAFCARNSDCDAGGVDGVCTPDPAKATQGDAVPPGTCTTGTLKFDPARLTTTASANYLISANFFRIRDGFRQALLDQAIAALALARPPAGVPQPPGNPLATALAGTGVAVDPTRVYFAGASLGGIVGAPVAATNPRFKRAVLNVPAGLLVDAFTTSPSFAPAVDAIFDGLLGDGWQAKVNPADPAYDPVVASNYARTLTVAKWIVDPADPVNYATSVVNKTYDPGLAPLVAGGVGSATTAAYGQIVTGDQTLPDVYGRELLELAGFDYTQYTAADTIAAGSRHGLVGAGLGLDPADPRALAGAIIRGDLADFLDSLAFPGAAVDVP